MWSTSAKKSHYSSIQPPREPWDCRAYRAHSVLLQPPTISSAAHEGCTPARSRFQSCGQVSAIPLPFQLPDKRSVSTSWPGVKPRLYKIIWDARCGEINCQWLLAQLHSRAPTCINPIVHKKGRGQDLPLPNMNQISWKIPDEVFILVTLTIPLKPANKPGRNKSTAKGIKCCL